MKIHWWRSGRTFPACGDGSSAHLCGCTAHSYLERFNANPQMHCLKCRDLASAEELNYRSDSDRYAELRKIVEEWQSHITGSSQALADWRHR